MNCTDIHNLLDDALEGQLTELEQAALDNHLGACATCRQRMRQEQALRSALKALPVAPASSGFAARALRHAVESNTQRPQQKRSFVAGFATAAVVALVFLFVGSIYKPGDNAREEQPQPIEDKSPAMLSEALTPVPDITIALRETQRVKLTFNSSQAVQHVRISLSLPGNVELEGYPGKQQIAWSTDLKQGNNVLTLPFIANSPEGGKFIARIEYESQVNELQLNLNVGQPGLSTLDASRAA